MIIYNNFLFEIPEMYFFLNYVYIKQPKIQYYLQHKTEMIAFFRQII